MSAEPSNSSVSLSRLFWSWVILTLAVAVAALPLRVWLGQRFGEAGAQAVWAAAALCWLGGSLALSLHALFRDPKQIGLISLGGMSLRLAIIMGGYLIVSQQMPQLAKSGFQLSVMVFFLVTLVTETILLVTLVRSTGLTSAASSSRETSASAAVSSVSAGGSAEDVCEMPIEHSVV